ncbi:TIGR03773 family transporter-associated surface protein [Arthrobacter sp. UM1]|uniref:TIGR03773 family transporter-associated surface protein n=1 Tax=Arthrobacter sp. UM1 TaxID=2766776 RepID=UPI001CF653D9|nr:TIGR03773 family transporter-associated surface protein [Arthrobacter sp. UM1]MCB4208430.1 TIGR03773 family transporter-associated surface protein [Arthrobacter sp. UM1]
MARWNRAERGLAGRAGALLRGSRAGAVLLGAAVCASTLAAVPAPRAEASAPSLARASSALAAPASLTARAGLPHALPQCRPRSFERISSGHLDFGPVPSGAGLAPLLKDDRTQPPVWKAPGGSVLTLGAPARRAAPAGLEFIAPAGSPVYMIGGIQQAGVPWLGWNTQHPELLARAASDVRMTLVSVKGPGQLAVFTSGSFGRPVGQRIFDTVGGPRSATVPLNTHAHGNWVFTRPGAYQVTIGFAVRLKDGRTASGASTLNVAAGADTPDAAFSGCASSGGSRSGSGNDGAAAPARRGQAGGAAGAQGGSAGGAGSAQGGSAGGSSAGAAGTSAGDAGAGAAGQTEIGPPPGEVGQGGAPGEGPSAGAAQAGGQPGSAPGTATAARASGVTGFIEGISWPSAAFGAGAVVFFLLLGGGVYRLALGRPGRGSGSGSDGEPGGSGPEQ